MDINSVQFSHSVFSNSFQPHTATFQASMSIIKSRSLPKLTSIELVMPSNHLILSSVVPFSSRLQSFPTSGSFPISQFFASGGQSIGVLASASFLPMNIQDWFPVGSPCSPRDSQESSPTPQFKSINSLALSFPYSPTITSIISESENEVAQLCPTLCDSMDCRLPGSSIHGIFQARILEWVAISFYW